MEHISYQVMARGLVILKGIPPMVYGFVTESPTPPLFSLNPGQCFKVSINKVTKAVTITPEGVGNSCTVSGEDFAAMESLGEITKLPLCKDGGDHVFNEIKDTSAWANDGDMVSVCRWCGCTKSEIKLVRELETASL
jgi:hypothetical protein